MEILVGCSPRLKELIYLNYSSSEFTPKFRYRVIQEDADTWFHLVRGDEIIGCCSVRRENHRCHIENVYIEEKRRGNGYSKLLLLNVMESILRTHSSAVFHIVAHANNTPAVKVYKSLFGEPEKVDKNVLYFSL